jgi:RNA-binding protein YlmH
MSVYDHFRSEERPFVDRVLDWIEQADERYRIRVTDFLDPRQVFILRSLSSKYPAVSITVSGGYDQAERCRAVIHPSDVVPAPNELGLTLIEVTSPSPGFTNLKHQDFLGSLLGIGLKRDKFGDILINQSRVQFIVADEVASYVQLHFHQVHRVSVSTQVIPIDNAAPIIHNWKPKGISVASTRVDAVVGDVFGLSRSKALPPIRGGHLKVNWMTVDSPSFLLQEGDIVSLRGYGRFKVLELQGTSKKGKIRLEVGLLH